MTNIIGVEPQTPETLALDMPGGGHVSNRTTRSRAALPPDREQPDEPALSVAIVGAAETNEIGTTPTSPPSGSTPTPPSTPWPMPASRRTSRWRALRRPIAGRHRGLPGHHPHVARWHLRRRLFVHAPRPPRCRGDQGRPLHRRAHHARRKRPLARRLGGWGWLAPAAGRAVRGTLRHRRPANSLHHPGPAPHERVRPHPRAARLGRRRPRANGPT